MKKNIVIVTVIVVIAGFFVGKYLHNKTNKAIKNNIMTKNIIAERKEINTGEKVLVDSKEQRTTPNTRVVKKVLYKDCNHLIITEETLKKEELVNLNELQFKEKIPGYEIQKFTPEEVVIYKEVDDFCDEHYLLKDNEGFLGIYRLDENDAIGELIELTEIPTDFLPDEDKDEIKNGLKIETQEELSKVIEDFE